MDRLDNRQATTDTPRVTIIVAPRERFEQAVMSIRNCLETADLPFRLIYVDGGSPTPIASELREIVESAGHAYRRFEGYVTPNFARNAVLPEADTDYVVFIDNDVSFQPGWLSALVRCADETGAGLVTPTILVGPGHLAPDLKVHHAGGILDLTPGETGASMFRRHRFEHQDYLSCRRQLKREETASTEFHTVLARKSMLDQIGPFDLRLVGFTDEIDMAFNARRHGWKIFYEPESIVVYDVGKPITRREIPFFCLRWSRTKCMRAEKYFYKKWGLAPDFQRQRDFLRNHRRHAFPFRMLQRLIGWRITVTITSLLCETIALLTEPRFVRPETLKRENT